MGIEEKRPQNDFQNLKGTSILFWNIQNLLHAILLIVGS